MKHRKWEIYGREMEKKAFRAVNSEALRFEISKAGWAIWQDTFLLSPSGFSHFSIT